MATTLIGDAVDNTALEIVLTDFHPNGEVKAVAAALYTASSLPDAELLQQACTMSTDKRTAVLGAYVGDHQNRCHRPGRAFERTNYRFDIVADYAAFRDLLLSTRSPQLLIARWIHEGDVLVPLHPHRQVPLASNKSYHAAVARLEGK